MYWPIFFRGPCVVIDEACCFCEQNSDLNMIGFLIKMDGKTDMHSGHKGPEFELIELSKR